MVWLNDFRWGNVLQWAGQFHCPKPLNQSEANHEAIDMKIVFLLSCRIEEIFTTKILHLASFSKWEVLNLRNGLFSPKSKQCCGKRWWLHLVILYSLHVFSSEWFHFTPPISNEIVLNVITFCPNCNRVLSVITIFPKCNKLLSCKLQ